jgi:hypothetical protein
MNNPPAFPIVIDMGDGVKYQTGMTLRDYMAAKAMQGMFCHDTSFVKEWQDQAAQDAYAMADAMLKAREA